MNTKHLTPEFANKVYDILVTYGGAVERDRSSFIYHHCEDKYGCMEWRFCGKLGFGGKYRSQNNRVTMYSEDRNPEREKLKENIDLKLSLLKDFDSRYKK